MNLRHGVVRSWSAMAGAFGAGVVVGLGAALLCTAPRRAARGTEQRQSAPDEARDVVSEYVARAREKLEATTPG
jgi:hypothetical protein